MRIDTLTIRSVATAAPNEAPEGATRAQGAEWLAATVTIFAMTAVLLASGLAVVMSFS